MAFDAVIGQKRVKAILARAVFKDRLPHALLFHGPEGTGKDALAIELAKRINCQEPPCSGCPSCLKVAKGNHPDVHLIFPAPSKIKPEELGPLVQEKFRQPYSDIAFSKATSISINAVRDLQRAISYRPFEGKMKVAVICQADKMTSEAANAFLKSLEEPPPDTLLILTTAKPHALLPTILSRCQRLRFDPLSEAEIEAALLNNGPAEPHRVRLAASLAVGNYRRAREFLEHDIDKQRAEALTMLQAGMSGSVAQMVEVSETYAQRLNVDELKHLLTISLLWMRDLIELHRGRDEVNIANRDRLDELRTWAGSHTESDVRRWITAVNRTLDMFNRNVNTQLALIGLMLQYQRPNERRTNHTREDKDHG